MGFRLVRLLSVRLVRGGSVEPIEVRAYLVKCIGVEVAVDIRGDGRRGVPPVFWT
jgi:hypothetical protein